MKYLNKSFSSQPTNDNYRGGFPNSFPGGEPMGSSLTRCPKCGTYFAAKRGSNTCPKGCSFSAWTEPAKNGKPMCEWNGAKLRISMVYHGAARKSFSVELVEGKWPSDGDLITLCDGDTPPHARHFGGVVRKSLDGKSASVDVYVD